MIEDGSASVAIVLPGRTSATRRSRADDPGHHQRPRPLRRGDPARGAPEGAAVGRHVGGRREPARRSSTRPSTARRATTRSPTTRPALVGFFVYFFVYLLTGVSFLRERTGGTLERLMATPVSRGEIVIGYTLGFGLFAIDPGRAADVWVLGTVHVPAIGPLPAFSIGLGVAVAGSPLLAFLVVLLLAIGAVSLGIFLSTFARTELQIIQFIPIVLVPQFLLSGVLFPLSSLPAVIQPFAPIMPLTLRGRTACARCSSAAPTSAVGQLQLDLLVLAAFAVFFATIASLTIRREVA